MSRFDGSLARKLDFGETLTSAGKPMGSGRRPLRIAALAQGRPFRLPGFAQGGLTGPDKYKALERRRRRAQIAARHELGLLD